MKKITSVKAVGYQIIVEMLTQQEAMGTSLVLNNAESTQAYVKYIGPLVDEKCGLQVGDRVILQGQYIPVPNPTDNSRKWGAVEMHGIKAVLGETEVE